jgi:hypothetical protein
MVRILCADFSQKKKKKRLGTSAAAAAADAVVATNALVMSVVSSRNVNLDAISESINQGSVASYAMQGAINNVTGDGRKSREGSFDIIPVRMSMLNYFCLLS